MARGNNRNRRRGGNTPQQVTTHSDQDTSTTPSPRTTLPVTGAHSNETTPQSAPRDQSVPPMTTPRLDPPNPGPTSDQSRDPDMPPLESITLQGTVHSPTVGGTTR